MKKEMPIEKFIALDEEINASINLIQSGLAELQKLDLGNDFYYLPFLLLSNGFEKLLKVYICFYFWENFCRFPIFSDFKRNKNDNGHNLVYLKDKIAQEYFTQDRPALKDDYNFLMRNEIFNKILSFLGDFGQYSRYYNLDIIIDNPRKQSRDIKKLWVGLESELLIKDQNLFSRLNVKIKNLNKEKIEDLEKINYEVQQKIVVILEVFARALTRQFILGD